MIYNTYFIVNNSMINHLKKIDEFELDLGQSLTAPEQKMKDKIRTHVFLPGDTIVQNHYSYYGEIINKLGHLGILTIYSDFRMNNNEVRVCNMDKSKVYNINLLNNIYDELNSILGAFLVEFDFVSEEDKEEKIKEEEGKVEKMKEVEKMEERKQRRSFIISGGYSNEEAEKDLDVDINRPIITNSELEKKREEINHEFNKIKNKPLSEMTMDERIIYARSMR